MNNELEITFSDEYNGAVKFLKYVGMGLIVVISAALTFSFFADYVGGLVTNLIGVDGRLISALVGAFVFDFMAIVWLQVYLRGGETKAQRDYALGTSVACMAGSAVASLAQIILGTGLVALDANGQQIVGYSGVAVVSVGVILNFVTVWLFSKNTHKAKLLQQAIGRANRLEAAQSKQVKNLDNLVANRLEERLTGIADEIADEQAKRIVDKFYREEMQRYANAGNGAREPETVKN